MANEITALRVTLDRTNYSRYEPARSVVKATVSPTPGSGVGSVTVKIIKARKSGGEVIATQGLSLSGAPKIASFDLVALRDVNGYIAATRSEVVGDYRLTATLDSDVNVVDDAWFTVSLITVEEMRKRWLLGLPLLMVERLSIRSQPVLVTGVTVTDILPGSGMQPGVLAFAHSGMTLSWNGGAAVAIGSQAALILSDTVGGGISVAIDPTALPAADISEILYVDAAVMSDETILAEIEDATNDVERQMRVYLEPHYVVSRMLLDEEVNTDVPVDHGYDDVADGLTWYKPPDPMRWMSLGLPRRPLLKLFSLTGYFNRTKTVTLPKEWITWTEKSAFIEMVPSNMATVPWIFYGPGFYTFIATQNAVPQFWQFYAVCGLRDCPSTIIQYVAKRAAIPLLIQAGLARLPSGAVGKSISRDGVSESISTMPGLYRVAIEQYERELGRDAQGNERGLQALFDRYCGIPFVTL